MTGIISPIDNKKIGELIPHSNEDIQNILETADMAFSDSWASLTILERAKIARKFGELLKDNKEQLAIDIAIQMGKPLSEGRAEIEKSISLINAICVRHQEYFSISNQIEYSLDHDNLDVTIEYVPTGIILGIMPWNFPIWQVARALIPNVVGGNVFVLKHAEQVTDIALKLEEMFLEAGAPKGVFSVILAKHEQVESVISDPRVQGVTLTGSVRAGRKIASIAGLYGKKTVLELGGSDPFIICDDADIKDALDALIPSRFSNCGQVCIATKRVIIDQSIYDEVLANIIQRVSQLKVGSPLDETTDIGPLCSQSAREYLELQVEKTIDAGAHILIGGKTIEGSGFYFEPTVMDDIPDNSPAVKEEIFGPVLSVFKSADDDDAIRIANNTEFGLGATVFSRDFSRANRIARAIKSGMVAINTINTSHPIVPFGGVKASGYGRELGSWGVLEFMNVRTISIAQ